MTMRLPYPGIHAHLNSLLQTPDGGWESFHAMYITQFALTLNPLLPENYHAVPEKSLQITQDDDPESTVTGVGIYRFASKIGTLVGRIEVLSPANKPGAGYHARYLERRQETLAAGVTLVELDYLHQYPPILAALPNYAAHHPAAYPYYALVSVPHSGLREGLVYMYGINVLDRLPVIDIPLDGAARIACDLNTAYQAACASLTLFQQLVDESQAPVNSHYYRPVDRDALRQWMMDKL